MTRRFINILWWTLVVVIFAGAMAWRFQWVPSADDLIYLRKTLAANFFVVGNEPISTFADLCESIKIHYLYFIPRLTNFIAMALLMQPPWLVDIVCGLFVAVLPLLVAMLVGGGRTLRDPLTLALATFLVWLCCPWYNCMESVDFLINYVFTADGILLLMILYCRDKTWFKYRTLWWFIPLTMICCIMHETMTLSFLAWAVMRAIVLRKISKKELAVILTAFVGLIYLMTGPGMVSRVNEVNFILSLHNIRGLLNPPLSVTVVSIFVVAWLCIPKIRKMLNNELPLLAASIVGIAISFYSNINDRSLLFPTLCSIVIILQLFDLWFRTRIGAKWSLAIVSIITIVLAAFFSELAWWSNKVAKDCQAVIRQIETTGSNIVFADIISREDLPWYVLDIPFADQLTSWHHIEYYSRFYGFKDRIIVVLPTAFRGKPIREWHKLPGDNPWYGTNYRFFADHSYFVPAIDITYGDTLRRVDPLNSTLIRLTGGPERHRVATLEVTPPVYIGQYMGDSIFQYWNGDEKRWYRNRNRTRFDTRLIDDYTLDPPISYYPDL